VFLGIVFFPFLDIYLGVPFLLIQNWKREKVTQVVFPWFCQCRKLSAFPF